MEKRIQAKRGAIEKRGGRTNGDGELVVREDARHSIEEGLSVAVCSDGGFGDLGNDGSHVRRELSLVGPVACRKEKDRDDEMISLRSSEVVERRMRERRGERRTNTSRLPP